MQTAQDSQLQDVPLGLPLVKSYTSAAKYSLWLVLIHIPYLSDAKVVDGRHHQKDAPIQN